MTAETPLLCERAALEHAPGLLALFEAAGSGCYCNYWHFEGDKNAWLEQCYLHPERNRLALEARLARGELCGVVALTPQERALVGWLKLTAAPGLPRLYQQRVYKSLPCLQDGAGAGAEREGVYAIGCVYVAESLRGRGVARELLGAAIDAVRNAGGRALEAFPRGLPEGQKLRDDEIWMGPKPLFDAAGFEVVSDFRPYPVLRLSLA